MEKYILIRWDEASIRGYEDVLPAKIVRSASHGSTIEHGVRGPRKGHYGLARCRVEVHDAVVDLDYTAFDALNVHRGMERGTMRLVFVDASRRVVRRVEWRDAGAKDFQPAEASVVPPSGLSSTEALYEGAVKAVRGETYVRDPRLRRRCIAHHGSSCFVCGFDFGRVYGNAVDGFIHVHHITPLGAHRQPHRVHPVRDLRPVCPNCHAVLHLRPTLGISGLKKVLSK